MLLYSTYVAISKDIPFCFVINKHFQHSKFPTIVTWSCITFQHIAKDLKRPHNSLLLYVYAQNYVCIDDMAHFQFIIVMLHFQKIYCIAGMLGEFTFLKIWQMNIGQARVKNLWVLICKVMVYHNHGLLCWIFPLYRLSS